VYITLFPPTGRWEKIGFSPNLVIFNNSSFPSSENKMIFGKIYTPEELPRRHDK